MPERNDIVYFLSSSRVPKASMVDMIVLEGCAAVEESIMAAGVEI
jgi:catalase (peroxidase I)